MSDHGTGRPRAGSAGERRGRHAAPPNGPRGPVDRILAATLALLALGRERAWAPLSRRIAPAREQVAAQVTAFRAGPVLPWVSRYRIPVLFGGALLVSAVALGGAAAMISSTPPVAGADRQVVDDGDRPRPGSEFTMPTPLPSTPAPTPTPTPAPTPAPAPSSPVEPPAEPEPTTEPADPPAEPEDDAPGNSGNSPGATNRPDKQKG